MKRIGYLIVGIVLVLFIVGCGSEEESSAASVKENAASKFLGEWEGTDGMGQSMMLSIHKGKPMRLTLRVSGPDGSFVKQGTCAFDLSKDPAHFTMTFLDREIKTIIESIDEDTFAFENVGSGGRPDDFGKDELTMERR